MKTLCLISIFMLSSCSINKMVIGFASPIVDGGITALFEEEDYLFAKDAMAGQLKLLEGFLVTDPENEGLLVNASMGFAAYSLGFIEDYDKERASKFYLRSRKYGLRALRQNSDFAENEKKKVELFEKSLNSFDEDDVPALFWTAISWGQWIQLNLHNPRALAQLSRVEALMHRVKVLNPRYFGGGPDLFFGAIECVKPVLIGGDKEKGLKHFESALEYSNNDFLLVKAFIAQYYATAAMDEELFDKLAKEVLAAGPPKNPANNLPNAIAKQKMKYLMTQKEELF